MSKKIVTLHMERGPRHAGLQLWRILRDGAEVGYIGHGVTRADVPGSHLHEPPIRREGWHVWPIRYQGDRLSSRICSLVYPTFRQAVVELARRFPMIRRGEAVEARAVEVEGSGRWLVTPWGYYHRQEPDALTRARLDRGAALPDWTWQGHNFEVHPDEID